jgi:hypothetical protein
LKLIAAIVATARAPPADDQEAEDEVRREGEEEEGDPERKRQRGMAAVCHPPLSSPLRRWRQPPAPILTREVAAASIASGKRREPR